MVNAKQKSVERRKLILNGDIFKTILIVCLPLAIYQLFNSVSTLIDQIICADISTEASNAVASIAQLKNTISAFGGGLAAGGAVLVARYFGAGDIKMAKKSSGNLLVMSIILSIIIIAIFIPLAKPIMKICQISDVAIEIGYTYFVLQLFELAIVSLNNVFIGLEKAKGNSKIILYLNVGVILIKLGLTCLFVYGCHFDDIFWVEVATIIAQASLLGVGIFYMFRKANILQVTPSTFKISKVIIKDILFLSIPIFFGKFIMNLGKVTVNALCGLFYNVSTDSLIVGALGISNNISGVVTGMTSTLEDSESSIVSQNLGNGNLKRTIKFFIRIVIIAAIVAVAGYVLTRFIFLDELVNLFNSNDDKGAYYTNMIKEIYVYDSLSIPALGICSAVLGLLYGYGKTFLATILNFSRIGVRILSIVIIHYTLPEVSGPTCAGISMGISNGTILLLSLVFFAIFFISLKKHGYHGMHLADNVTTIKALRFEEEETEEN